jgi:hypothetical protein
LNSYVYFFLNSKFWNRNSNFLIFQQQNSKKNPPEIFGIKNGIGIPLPKGSQKSELKIGIPNQACECAETGDVIYEGFTLLWMIYTVVKPNLVVDVKDLQLKMKK